jgi:hypothetical protein
MITQIDIVNKALLHLGQSPITSINEASVSAKRAKMVYDIAKDTVLRAHAWSFANKHQLLGLLANESVPAWDFLYVIPGDCLHLRRIYQDESVNYPAPPEKYEIMVSPITQTMCIGANIDQAYAKYTMKVTDHSKMDAPFAEALSLYLASMLAQPLTGDVKLGGTYFNMYVTAIKEAKLINMSEKSSTVPEYSSFIEAR